MATTVARLEAILSANTRDFDRAMSRSETRMGRAGKAAGVAGAAIAGGLVVGLTKSVKAAMEAQKADTRLEQAYKTNVKGGITPFRKEIEKASKAAINLGFDDEDLKDSLGSLAVATKNNKKAIADSNVAMDLARFKGIGLEQATKMLTMAMGGSQRAVKQLGISVTPVTTEYDKLKAQFGKHISAAEKVELAQAKINDKQATAAKVIQTVKEKVEGQAKAYSETAEGKMKVFQQKSEELQQSLGEFLIPALETVVDKLNKAADWLGKHPKLMRAVVVALGLLAGALLAAAGAQAALNLAVLANPYVAATVAILALGVGVGILYKRFKELRPALEFFAETIIGLPLPLRLVLLGLGGVHGAVDKLHKPVMLLADAFHTVYNWLVKVKDLFQWIIDHAKGLGGIFKGIATGAGNAIGDVDPNRFKDMFGGFGTGPKSISPKLYDELSSARAMGLHLTSGYRKGARTKHGTRSDHSYYPSRAIDVADGPSQMRRFFLSLIGDRGVKQAFYDPIGSIFGGMLSSYREGGHSDHVHVATYDQGGWLRPGWNLAYNGLGRPEPVGAGNVTFNFPNYVGSKNELLSWLRNASAEFKRLNGRSAF